jgi:UDP-N-acetylglucosamine 2-epimerase (non-hydrolysing)/GDP/UDP-N,N'-diacetylbacillosamine 2-epimerase (hydrolysing)
MGLGTIGFAQAYGRLRPDILLVLGDRFEMYAAALAALPFKIPVAHVHGGEVTRGAIDDALRHSMTKLSHLHFVSTEEYARRVVQLGEEPWRVVVSGAPSLDNLQNILFLSREELAEKFDVTLDDTFLLVTYHPVTLEYEQTEWQFAELLAALHTCRRPLLFTMANADTHGRILNNMIQDFVSTHASAQAVNNLGTQGYFSAMALATGMVGNSSSGIIEAASFNLPVVNIGNRQDGRIRGPNVVDVDYKRTSILEGINKALDPAFRELLQGIPNPYGSGTASEKIVEVLKAAKIDNILLMKRFYDLETQFRNGID